MQWNDSIANLCCEFCWNCAKGSKQQSEDGQRGINAKMEKEHYDIETFLDTLPDDFDAWNRSTKLPYYEKHILGFETFTLEEQVQLIGECPIKGLKTVVQYLKVPQAFGKNMKWNDKNT